MSSVIKGDALGGQDIQGVYVIEQGAHTTSHMGHHGAEVVEEQVSPEEIAASLIEEAQRKSAEIIAGAEQSAERVRAEAYQAGYDAGFDSFADEKKKFTDRLAEIEEDIVQQVDESWQLMETEILKLSVDIARRIIREEVSTHQDVVLRMIRDGLIQIRDRQEIKIHVNPADYELVRGHKDEISGSCDGIRNLEIIDDRRVNPGDCMIETSNGNLDARVETQLAEIERILMEESQSGSTDPTSDAW